MIVQEDTTLGDKFTVLVAGSVIIEQGIRALKTNPVATENSAIPTSIKGTQTRGEEEP